jgi:hypothetical protein
MIRIITKATGQSYKSEQETREARDARVKIRTNAKNKNKCKK